MATGAAAPEWRMMNDSLRSFVNTPDRVARVWCSLARCLIEEITVGKNGFGVRQEWKTNRWKIKKKPTAADSIVQANPHGNPGPPKKWW